MSAQRSRPVIGLTTYRQTVRWGPWERDAAFVPGTYLDMVVRAGGRPVLIPPPDPDAEGRPVAAVTAGGAGQSGAGEAGATCDLLDGLVLVGGGDMVPSSYDQGEDVHTAGTSPDRDALELALLTRALERDLPVLAVCRGLQVLNVALGGDLLQHLPDRIATDAHRPDPTTFGVVTVTTEPDSHVRRLCGERVEVRCSHHQAIDRLGQGLRVTARSTDGVLEAAELGGHRFVVGLQWHPEEPGQVQLFEGLVAAARERRSPRSEARS